MTQVALAAITVISVLGALAGAGYVAHRVGRHRSPLSRRGVDWATSLGISAVLSSVLGLVMTLINVGPTAAFPAAFLTSVGIGIAVGTPTAYLVVPRVLRLTTPLGPPASAARDTSAAN